MQHLLASTDFFIPYSHTPPPRATRDFLGKDKKFYVKVYVNRGVIRKWLYLPYFKYLYSTKLILSQFY